MEVEMKKINKNFTLIENLVENNLLNDKSYYKIEEILRKISNYDSELADNVTDLFLNVKEEYFQMGVIVGSLEKHNI